MLQPIPPFLASLRFHPAIDLVDETLREGAERSSIAIDLDEKCELACALAEIGLRSLVIGMFPDVPHNVQLLKKVLRAQKRGDIGRDVRLLVISHVGETFRQTLSALEALDEPLDSVWIVAIHSVSDLQIRHLFPKILLKDPTVVWDSQAWAAASAGERRSQNLEWLDGLLPEIRQYAGGGIMAGLIDTFRADPDHVHDAVALVASHGISQVRLIDTAGTCVPHQVPSLLDPLRAGFPDVSFYCHFHDDFGLATGNAMLALGCGARGVDVSVGGFGNRAGHPALAEVAMALPSLYGVELPGFGYPRLSALSRRVERTYGLIERATQPLTGVITHTVQSGIRTELVGEARWMFDIIAPESVGATLSRSFGVRSGLDGMQRILAQHAQRIAEAGIEVTPELSNTLYTRVMERWEERSNEVKGELAETIAHYHTLLQRADFSEDEVMDFILELTAGPPEPVTAQESVR